MTTEGQFDEPCQHDYVDPVRLADEHAWMAHLLVTIRDKADLRYNGNRGLLAFSDLKDEAAKTFRTKKEGLKDEPV